MIKVKFAVLLLLLALCRPLFSQSIKVGAERMDEYLPLLAGKAVGRTDPKERIYAQIIGTGMLDVACAGLVLQKIAESGEEVFRYDMTK